MRILLATHAETEWNAQGRFLGHADVSLNERGRRQAQVLQLQLAKETLHAIVASDLRRARETAEILALPHGLPVECDPRLRELDFGAWEGLTHVDIKQKDAHALTAWQDNPLQHGPPGGESLAGLAQRLRAFLHDLGGRPQESVILLVAHRGSLRTLLCLLLGLPVTRHWEFRLDTAALSEVKVSAGKTVLIRLNEAPLESEVAHAG